MRGSILFLALVGCTSTPDADTSVSEEPIVGRCLYVNSFSQADECKEYRGENWDPALATSDCAEVMPGAVGAFEADLTCDRESILGECIVDEGGPEHTVLVFAGEYGDSCDGLDIGCGFAGGEYKPSPICGGSTTSAPTSSTVFTPFEQVCVDPLPGEPMGQSADGQVCTWEAISGATEEGRYFADYADCNTVVTQRPYWGADVTADTSSDDPRLSDDAWVEEYDWVTAQVEASACVCCHTTADAPNGEPSGWYLEAGPIWTDTLDDDGMAMLAGWIDSTAFGAFHAEDNNGFSREETGIPTTDSTRMKAYFEAELALRGVSPSDFTDARPFGGPLYDQLVYEPEACASGTGVRRNGSIHWEGGDARYVYVLEPDSASPGVPPNLDLPDGTLWRLDVAPTAEPIAKGFAYGTTPGGSSQHWPEQGSAPDLIKGNEYYLYVLADVYQPIERCTFVAK